MRRTQSLTLFPYTSLFLSNLHPGEGQPGLFEPVHGSAPPLAGKGVANPMATVLTGALLFEHLGHPEAGRDLERAVRRSEEHTSELQSRLHLVCRLLLEKKK